jgi:hypothetical protein
LKYLCAKLLDPKHAGPTKAEAEPTMAATTAAEEATRMIARVVKSIDAISRWRIDFKCARAVITLWPRSLQLLLLLLLLLL